MNRDEYYGLSNMVDDILCMHGILIQRDSTWDEEVPQETIDADRKLHLAYIKYNQKCERINRLQYEKECEDFHIPTCPICLEQYDPFSIHGCRNKSYDQGGA